MDFWTSPFITTMKKWSRYNYEQAFDQKFEGNWQLGRITSFEHIHNSKSILLLRTESSFTLLQILIIKESSTVQTFMFLKTLLTQHISRHTKMHLTTIYHILMTSWQSIYRSQCLRMNQLKGNPFESIVNANKFLDVSNEERATQ